MDRLEVEKKKVLVLDEGGYFHNEVDKLLPPAIYDVKKIHHRYDCYKNTQKDIQALIITETLENKIIEVLCVIQNIRQSLPSLPIILIASLYSDSLAASVSLAGVTDYIKYPFNIAKLSNRIQRHLGRTSKNDFIKKARGTFLYNDELLIGHSKSMRQVKQFILKTAKTNCNVLITGETGTGKELVAQALHMHSFRKNKPMITLNCAAVPDDLLEGELFGYEKGAFTGANTKYEGKLKLANGGTVFFDEIGDMSLTTQAKILRAIEYKEVYRLGGKLPVSLDFRVVAATNQYLEDMVVNKTFRNDLYYRLNVARILLPPLRERKEDIPLLIKSFLIKFNTTYKYNIEGFDNEAFGFILKYSWPGNVRELKNIIEASYINCSNEKIGVNDLPDLFIKDVANYLPKRSGDDNERDVMLAALFETSWNKSKAAKKLKWSRMTLYRKMEKYKVT